MAGTMAVRVSALITSALNQPLPPALTAYAGAEPRAYTQRGMELFKRNKIAESIKDFDRTTALDASMKPFMWQRGLSLFYVERLADAMVQFEVDVAVNPNDTEESIWRWLAQVRLQRSAAGGGLTAAEAVAGARADLLVVGRDSRPVMRAAMELFAGGGTLEALDTAGGHGGADGGASAAAATVGAGRAAQQSQHDRFYADLYIALYQEAVGDDTAALTALEKACGSPYGPASGDYMWHLALVHATVRGWVAAGPAAAQKAEL